MSIGNISDVLSRVSQIEQQVQQLENGSMLDSALGISGSSGSSGTSGTDATSSSDGTSSSSAGNFSDLLSQAQSADPTATAASAGTPDADASTASDGGAQLASAVAFPSLSASALGASSGAGSVALPGSASSMLTSAQQQFASTLSADTGLNPGVISAWLLSEESGSAAQERQAAGNNDWLNIGYTGSGSYGADDAVWSDPVSAANATAAWLAGQQSVAGYGTASSGIQAILQSVGQDPQTQLQALQQSGWSSGGYPDIDSLYAEVAG
ncbi:MAG TPA: hypothetical protein VME01_10275 [Solirubrobacteraceae bacterium]|nr:hypothetical protein [Solirubrobacteraceae bacterium]